MIDKKYSRIVLALTLVMLAASVATVAWGPVHGLVVQLKTLVPAMGVLLCWAFIRLWLRLCVGKPEKLDNAMGRFVGRVLVVAAVLTSTAALYMFASIWHGAPAFSPQLFQRLYLFAGGLIWIIFGNFVPKLPYQPKRRWLEMGPARYHHLNRIGGWLTVGGGIAAAIEALVIPMNSALHLHVFLAIAAAILLPYGALAVIYVRSYRQEMRAAANT